MEKRGVSPIIATIILVGITVSLAIIVMLWFFSFQEEVITKFNDQNVKVLCQEVDFSVEIVGSSVSLTNNANVPVYKFKIKQEGESGYTLKDITQVTVSWPSQGLNPGKAISLDKTEIIPSGIDSVTFIPVLLGNSEEGLKAYTCDENVGKEIQI